MLYVKAALIRARSLAMAWPFGKSLLQSCCDSRERTISKMMNAVREIFLARMLVFPEIEKWLERCLCLKYFLLGNSLGILSPSMVLAFLSLSIKFADASQSEEQVSAREQTTSNQAPANMIPSTRKHVTKHCENN